MWVSLQLIAVPQNDTKFSIRRVLYVIKSTESFIYQYLTYAKKFLTNDAETLGQTCQMSLQRLSAFRKLMARQTHSLRKVSDSAFFLYYENLKELL